MNIIKNSSICNSIVFVNDTISGVSINITIMVDLMTRLIELVGLLNLTLAIGVKLFASVVTAIDSVVYT